MSVGIQEAPTRPAAADAEFAPGSKPATHAYGVMYQGEYETPWDGTAVAVRLHARALASAGVPVFLKSFSGSLTNAYGQIESVHLGGLPSSVRSEVGELDRTSIAALYPVVKHLVIRDAEHLKRAIVPQGAIPKGGIEAEIEMRRHIFESTIVYSVWERDRVDPAIARLLSRVAENWVPCRANRDMLIRSGVPAEKVVVMPHPYDPADPVLKLRQRVADTKWRKFYSIGRWEPRKAYAELVEAFLRAFTPKDRVMLTIKYTGGRWPGYETPEELMVRLRTDESIRARGWSEAALADRVHLREGRFPRPEILRLHYTHNIYVCSSHGEAWCLPAFEAALAGNRLCYVAEGGVRDFADERRDVRIRSSSNLETPLTEPVPASYGWESDAEWACVSVGSLVYGLLQATVPTSHSGRIGMEWFSMEAVGAFMKARVLAIAAQRPPALEYYQSVLP
jgi:glycosyltransferase involved in cell wall biosynthesis